MPATRNAATAVGPRDTTFRRRVLFAVRRIPAGRVATYGDVAAAAGVPRAARAVGNIMKGCRIPGVPCHRVVAAVRRPGGGRGRAGGANAGAGGAKRGGRAGGGPGVDAEHLHVSLGARWV